MKKIINAVVRFFRWLVGSFSNKSGQFRLPWQNSYTIYSIERVTPCKNHAWINTSIGRIKKEIKNISGYGRLPVINEE